MAEEYRYLMAYGELVGRSHGLKTPCQDKALCIQKDGVNVAALSDGCGSAPLSEYGSRLTVEAVANFLVNNFDQLIANGFREDSHANLETRKALVKEIVDLELRMIKEDPEMNKVFSRYKEEHLDQYNSYLSRHTEECYWLSLMHATIVFFAEKNGKAIFGQIGDGFLGLLASGNMRIFIEEEKIPGAKNATCYPDNIYEFALTRPEGDKWYFYRSFKMGTASSEHIEAVMLTSDGVDSFFDKSVRYQMKYAQNAVNGLFGRIIQAESFEDRQDIINNMYLPKLVAGSSTFDDCSIALLVSPNAKVENCVVKEYPHDEEETDVKKEKQVPVKEDPTKKEKDVLDTMGKAKIDELEKSYIQKADNIEINRKHDEIILMLKQKAIEYGYEKYREAFYSVYIDLLTILVTNGVWQRKNGKVNIEISESEMKKLPKYNQIIKAIMEVEKGHFKYGQHLDICLVK